MISKAEAQQFAVGYLKTLPDRVNVTLEQNARVGIVGCAFSYAGIPAQVVTNAKAALAALGWTVVDDVPTTTITLT